VIWLATPAFFYSHASPPWSHSTSLFAVALFLTVWHGTRKGRTRAQFLLVGLLGGLVALVREQDGLFLLIPAVEGLLAYGEIVRRRDWPALVPLVGRHALLVLGSLSVFTLQLASYRVLHGYFGPSPIVGGKFNWFSPHFFQVLLDPHYGLLVWSPIVVLALGGLILLVRRDRLLAGVLGLAFLTQVYLAGAFLTWQSPGSFGQRRFVNCTVLFALGLAALIGWAREKGWPAWSLAGLGGLFVLWNAGLVAQWVLYPADREAGLLWDRLPRRLFVEIPRQAVDFVRRLLFERGSLYRNRGG
jgi:hypothetical protein